MPTFDATDLDSAVRQQNATHADVQYTDYNDAARLQKGLITDPRYKADSLVNHYSLHEETGSTHDISGEGNHAIDTVSMSYATGLLNVTCYSFGGRGSYVEFPSGLVTGNVSGGAWVNWAGLKNTNTRIISDIGGGANSGIFDLYVATENSNRLAFSANGGSTVVLGNTDISTIGGWFHVWAAYINGTGYVFLNGSQEGSASMNQGSPNSNAYLGADTLSPPKGEKTAWWDGDMLDARLYNAGLGQSDANYFYSRVFGDRLELETQYKEV